MSPPAAEENITEDFTFEARLCDRRIRFQYNSYKIKFAEIPKRLSKWCQVQHQETFMPEEVAFEIKMMKW